MHGLAGQECLTFGVAIGVHRVIGKADFVSFAGGVNNKIWKKNPNNKKKENCSVTPGLPRRAEPPARPAAPCQEAQVSPTPQSRVTVVEVEEEAGHVLVIDLPAPVSLVL